MAKAVKVFLVIGQDGEDAPAYCLEACDTEAEADKAACAAVESGECSFAWSAHGWADSDAIENAESEDNEAD